MSDDFINLVQRANPATREYQPPSDHIGNPPSRSNAQYDLQPTHTSHQSPAMDPFFDDEDDTLYGYGDGPDSGFGTGPAGSSIGGTAPMRSMESGLPLARSAAPHAGTSNLNLNAVDLFGDEEPTSSQGPLSPGPGGLRVGAGSTGLKASFKHSWTSVKWPWRKEKILLGERIVTLNDTSGANAEFCSNSVSTSKVSETTFGTK